MDLMSSKLKSFGHSFSAKRKIVSQPAPSLGPPSTVSHNPAVSTSSTTSLPAPPMNQQPPPTGLGRPPSYTYNSHHRSASPMPPVSQQTMSQHTPPINTGAYPPGHPALAGPQPPGYGGGYPTQPPNGMHNAPQPTLGQYGVARPVEVEGAGRSKAQLIVGIDFVR